MGSITHVKADWRRLLIEKISVKSLLGTLMMSLFVIWMIQSYINTKNIDIGVGIALSILVLIPLASLYVVEGTVTKEGYRTISYGGIVVIAILIGLLWLLKVQWGMITEFSIVEQAFSVIGLV